MRILITGAAQGIGAAIATHLARPENWLVLVDLQEDKLRQFANTISGKCKHITGFVGDLTDPTFMKTVQDFVAVNPIDVLINDAAIAPKLAVFSDQSVDLFDKAYHLNIRVPFQLIQAVLPGMQVNGGMILNVASRANIYGYKSMAIYAATKAAITSLTGTVALDYLQVKAITIIPGRTNTPMQAGLRGESEASKYQSADYVGETISKVIYGEIPTESGNHVLIDDQQYKVLTELDIADLHRNMH